MVSEKLHVVLFPFMSKGHTIPIFHLARLLHHRGATVTIFTTPGNLPFFENSLSDVTTTIIDLPFPGDIEGVPPGIESTDKLPSMSMFPRFANATKLMKPRFESELRNLPKVSFMVTDGFFGWTLDSANNLGIPRLVYFGMNYFSSVVSRAVVVSGVLARTEDDNEPFDVPGFSGLKITGNDFDHPFRDRKPKGELFDFVMEQIIATSNSHGMLVNSFYDLESEYIEYYNKNSMAPKAWPVGPLCLAEPATRNSPENQENRSYMKWLDEMAKQGKRVLYVAFGSQAEISPEQMEEIKKGLEESQVNFLWVLRTNQSEVPDGFENRVKNRGMVIAEWVDQREILAHPSITGFLSHCGWNSVLETICAAVPVIAWPMMAEQHLNARLVVEVIKIGVRVEPCDGSVRGFVRSDSVEKCVKELMKGQIGKEARKKVKELSEAAINAMQEGGSSSLMLDDVIHQFHAKRLSDA